MDVETITKINEIAGNLTLTGFVLVILWGFVTGKIITIGRFADCVERAIRAEMLVDELRVILQSHTTNSLALAESLRKLTEKIDDMAKIKAQQTTRTRRNTTETS